jgi:hypothetical protein
MRRDIGMVLAGLGAFLILMAVAFPVYLQDRLVKFPLTYSYQAILNSPNTTYFSPQKITEVTGANVQAVYTLTGDAAAGNSSTSVWNLDTYLHDTAYPGHTGDINYSTGRFAFDRKTAQLRNCCGAGQNGKPVVMSGIAGFVWPIGTQQKTYMVFDTTLDQPEAFTYSGTDTVDGILTYKFTEVVPPTKIGFSPLSQTEPEFYQLNATYWVDPDTGALLKVSEHQQQFLENPITSARTTTLFDGTLTPTDASVAHIAAIDNSGRIKKTLFETGIPLISGILGAALLAWGLLLGVRRRRDFAESGFDAMTRELAAAAPPDESGTGAQATGTQATGTQATGGKHAAGSSNNLAGIVPGMDADAREASSPSAEGENPDKADPSPR